MKRELKALALDKISLHCVDQLNQMGITVRVENKMSADELAAAIGQCHLLLVRSATKVTPELLKRAKKLLAVGRGGVGMDNINIKVATELGIVTFNTPGANAESVAECTLSMILAAMHDLSSGQQAMNHLVWNKNQCHGRSLQCKTVGIIGLGAVGKWLSKMLEPFNVRQICYDNAPATALPWVPLLDLDDVLGQADVISLNLPLTSQTHHIINAEKLKKVKPGAIIVNSARGELVDENAIVEALRSSRLRAYATDVYSNEPPDFTKDAFFAYPDLRQEGKLILTPHTYASSDDAQDNVAKVLAEQAIRYLIRGEMPWGANFPNFSLPRQSQSRLLVFHPDAKGMMSGIAEVVKGFVNVAACINQRIDKGNMAYTIVDIDGPIKPEMVENIRKTNGVCRVHWVQ